MQQSKRTMAPSKVGSSRATSRTQTADGERHLKSKKRAAPESDELQELPGARNIRVQLEKRRPVG